MARVVTRVIPLVSRTVPVPSLPAIILDLEWSSVKVPIAPYTLCSAGHLQTFSSSQKRSFHNSYHYLLNPRPFVVFFAALRSFRKVRWCPPARRQGPVGKKLELRVNISTEEGLSDDHEIVNIVEMLKLDAPMALKMVFDSLKELECRAQNPSVGDIGKYEKIELSLLLCKDELISKLQKEWKGSNCPSGFLSRIYYARELEIPILMLGDIVISVEAAARQAVGRGHKLLDEIRILMIHSLLHLLGFDREAGDETSTEMEKLEELVLRSLGWKRRGLKKVAYDIAPYDIQ